MGRLKFIAFGLLSALGLLIVAMVVAILTFDANDYKDRIETAVAESTGRTFTIGGELNLSLLPWLAIDVADVTLGNRPGFGDEPMFEVTDIRLALKILPLFTGNLEVGEIIIDGAKVRLTVAKDGSDNWSDIFETLGDEEAGEPSVADKEESGVEVDVTTESGDIRSLRVAGIALTNADVSYVDAQADSSFAFEDFNLVTGALAPATDMDIKGGFRFASNPAALAGTIEYDLILRSPTEGESVELADLSITGVLAGDDIQELPLDLDLKQLVYDFVAQSLSVDELAIDIANLKVESTFKGTGFDAAPTLTGSVRIPDFSAKDVASRLAVEVPATADPDALNQIGASFAFSMNNDLISMSDLELRLDDTRLAGSASIRSGELNRYEFKLAGDAINVDRYLAPADAGGSSDAASMDATPIPTEMLDGLAARGELTFTKATLNGMNFTGIELGLSVADKQLRLHPIKANLFDGSYQGDIRINAKNRQPVLSLNETIAGVKLGPLAEALFETENLSGTMGGNFKLSGRGKTLGAIRETLEGNLRFALSDGALEGQDIWYQIRRARALFKKTELPAPPANPRTEFSDVSGTGVVAKGIINNQDFKATIPFMQLTGRGTLNLAASTVDYRMDARVLERPEFVDGTAEELDEFTEAVIPLKITGALADPSITPDINALVKAQAKKEIDKKKDELKGKLLDKLGLGSDEEPAAEGEEANAEQDPEDELKDKAKEALNDLFRR